MTEKVFWLDPYLDRLNARISQVDGDDIQLDRSIFFAFSGGQESDHGTIAGQPVLQANKSGRELIYQLPPNHGLQVGDEVEVRIDRTRRLRLMRLHLAAELVLELLTQRHPELAKIGAHISADKARIDFATNDSIAPLLADIVAATNQLIESDQPIISAFSDAQNERRCWEIEGFARVPCGGTHPRSTGEVGEIHLRRRNPGKGSERVEISLVQP